MQMPESRRGCAARKLCIILNQDFSTSGRTASQSGPSSFCVIQHGKHYDVFYLEMNFLFISNLEYTASADECGFNVAYFPEGVVTAEFVH